MAKQDAEKQTKVNKVSEGTQPAPQAPVPDAAVGKVTTETVETKPASQVKAQDADANAPAVPRRQGTTTGRTGETPRRATRQTREQRQRTRQELQRQRAERRAQTQQTRATQTPEQRRAERETQREANLEERTIKVSLPARSWQALERRLERSGQEEGAYFRRLLGPLLR